MQIAEEQGQARRSHLANLSRWALRSGQQRTTQRRATSGGWRRVGLGLWSAECKRGQAENSAIANSGDQDRAFARDPIRCRLPGDGHGDKGGRDGLSIVDRVMSAPRLARQGRRPRPTAHGPYGPRPTDRDHTAAEGMTSVNHVTKETDQAKHDARRADRSRSRRPQTAAAGQAAGQTPQSPPVPAPRASAPRRARGQAPGEPKQRPGAQEPGAQEGRRAAYGVRRTARQRTSAVAQLAQQRQQMRDHARPGAAAQVRPGTRLGTTTLRTAAARKTKLPVLASTHHTHHTLPAPPPSPAPALCTTRSIDPSLTRSSHPSTTRRHSVSITSPRRPC